jgi:hypothetical protein
MSPRLATFLVFAVNGAMVGTWVAHIPWLQDHLGISKATLGFCLLFMAAGALVSMPLTGHILDRLPSASVTRPVIYRREHSLLVTEDVVRRRARGPFVDRGAGLVDALFRRARSRAATSRNQRPAGSAERPALLELGQSPCEFRVRISVVWRSSGSGRSR